MKKKILIILGISLLLVLATYAKHTYLSAGRLSTIYEINTSDLKKLRDGDIIFQISQSSQCIAIQRATGSKYSHCGIIYIENGNHYVYEAVQPVKLTQLNKWIARGKNKHYVVKRLKNADKVLTPSVLHKMKTEGEKFYNKDYDLTFEWSDDKIYCSELVWKIYKRGANIEIGNLQKLKEFDLTDDLVRQKLKERYGKNIPMDETVISPIAVFDSNLLETVALN